ncbi:MAG: hypothetical protein ABIE43_00945 [Patescibacteria group bacterium]
MFTSVESIKPDCNIKNEIICDKPGSPALVPQESTTLEINTIIPYLTKEAIENTIQRINNNEFSIPFNIEFYYDYDISPSPGINVLSLELWPDKVVTNYTDEQ